METERSQNEILADIIMKLVIPNGDLFDIANEDGKVFLYPAKPKPTNLDTE